MCVILKNKKEKDAELGDPVPEFCHPLYPQLSLLLAFALNVAYLGNSAWLVLSHGDYSLSHFCLAPIQGLVLDHHILAQWVFFPSLFQVANIVC